MKKKKTKLVSTKEQEYRNQYFDYLAGKTKAEKKKADPYAVWKRKKIASKKGPVQKVKDVIKKMGQYGRATEKAGRGTWRTRQIKKAVPEIKSDVEKRKKRKSQ
jgi:hypothetical protein